MEEPFKSMSQKLEEHLSDPKNLAEAKKHFEENRWDKDIPKGWVSIEDHLPMWCIGEAVEDMFNGTTYTVRDKDGYEFKTKVLDHNSWYYRAKAEGVTHWLNK